MLANCVPFHPAFSDIDRDWNADTVGLLLGVVSDDRWSRPDFTAGHLAALSGEANHWSGRSGWVPGLVGQGLDGTSIGEFFVV